MFTLSRSDFVRGAVASLGFAVLGAAPALAQTSLRFAHFSVEDDPNHRAATELADMVAAATGGSVTIAISPNSQLGGEVDVVEGILLGTIDMAPPSAAVLANWVPEMNVLNMPFVFRDWDHYQSVLNGPIYDELSAAAAPKGLRLLGFMTSGPRHIMTTSAVNGMEDLAGRKIRTVQNPVHVATFNAFGANATAIAYPEVYSSLQTGVVDGADAANTNYFTAKFYEVAPYWAQVSWLFYTNPIVISEAKFQSFDEATQTALLEAGRKVGQEQQADWRASDDELLAELTANGVTVTTPDPAPFRAAAEAIYTEFLTTDEEKRLVALITQ
ncbi:MAG: TRAP transporter substrate-binding protein [Pseudotabrizicola sp.]|uniref:TRAP transporter substrate-binding protein n=1 Tax=Pseudotabrizicola sp. TaxID=2939647 RepID=UPI002724DFC7|nr:TRAP transporter substrate-binding protein [Pseudotabrizicola sp.]MDO9636952.1 TRAP transporter substrate-binding protein [Pseudotabrizicola sp.]